LSERRGEPVRFEKVVPGDEQILEDREQRELDGADSLLARRYEENWDSTLCGCGPRGGARKRERSGGPLGRGTGLVFP